WLIFFAKPRHPELPARQQLAAFEADAVAPGLDERGELGVAPLVRELDPVAHFGGQGDALAEDTFMALEREVADLELAPSAELCLHFGDVGVDLVVAHRACDRHA